MSDMGISITDLVLTMIVGGFVVWSRDLFTKAPDGVNPKSLGSFAILILVCAIAIYIRIRRGFTGSLWQIGRFIIGLVSLITAFAGVIAIKSYIQSASTPDDGFQISQLSYQVVGYLVLMLAGISGVVFVLIKERKSSPPSGE